MSMKNKLLMIKMIAKQTLTGKIRSDKSSDATCHTSDETLTLLKEIFGNRNEF